MNIEFVKQAFSDAGTPSSSRLLTAIHSAVASFCLIYLVMKTHTWPDGTVTAGLGAFSTAHYFVNRASNMFKKDDSTAVK